MLAISIKSEKETFHCVCMHVRLYVLCRRPLDMSRSMSRVFQPCGYMTTHPLSVKASLVRRIASAVVDQGNHGAVITNTDGDSSRLHGDSSRLHIVLNNESCIIPDSRDGLDRTRCCITSPRVTITVTTGGGSTASHGRITALVSKETRLWFSRACSTVHRRSTPSLLAPLEIIKYGAKVHACPSPISWMRRDANRVSTPMDFTCQASTATDSIANGFFDTGWFFLIVQLTDETRLATEVVACRKRNQINSSNDLYTSSSILL